MLHGLWFVQKFLRCSGPAKETFCEGSDKLALMGLVQLDLMFSNCIDRAILCIVKLIIAHYSHISC